MPGQCRSIKCWSWRRDLNPRPSDYKSDALPTELRQQSGTTHPYGHIYPSDPFQMSGTILKGTITVISVQPGQVSWLATALADESNPVPVRVPHVHLAVAQV